MANPKPASRLSDSQPDAATKRAYGCISRRGRQSNAVRIDHRRPPQLSLLSLTIQWLPILQPGRLLHYHGTQGDRDQVRYK